MGKDGLEVFPSGRNGYKVTGKISGGWIKNYW